VKRDEQSPRDRLISAREAADFFGMSRDWVYDRALAGDLPSYKLPGGKRRFLHSELVDAIKRFREGPPPVAS
jgi:excisionase family DNA binding protein